MMSTIPIAEVILPARGVRAISYSRISMMRTGMNFSLKTEGISTIRIFMLQGQTFHHTVKETIMKEVQSVKKNTEKKWIIYKIRGIMEL